MQDGIENGTKVSPIYVAIAYGRIVRDVEKGIRGDLNQEVLEKDSFSDDSTLNYPSKWSRNRVAKKIFTFQDSPAETL